jgi:hypothetical protein|tara:strand:+ start:248 stop:1273 length:1026 start_codon:yes stop_codon:yes gene_type:complete
MSQSLNNYIIRASFFLLFVFIIVVLLYPILQNAFLSNIFINFIIILGLFVGVAFNFYHLISLNNKFISFSNFNITNSIDSFANLKGQDRNISLELKNINEKFVFKSSSIDRLIENSDMTLVSIRETSRYLVGLLVFLGLLGTFWGLLKTIGSVGDVINGLGIDDTNVAGFFNSLKDGLNAPLEGMSIAFSSSLLGLAGSLILGLLDLNLGQAQNKYSQYFEKTLSTNSSPDFVDKVDKPTNIAIQKIYDNLDNIVSALKKSAENQNNISKNLDKFNEVLKKINNNSSNLDKQLSNFLSSQLNTQSSLIQLTDAISKNGILEAKKIKEYFQSIEKDLKKIKK